VQEMVFYKNISGKLDNYYSDTSTRHTNPICFFLPLVKLDDTGVPFSHPLCSWPGTLPSLAGWLWDNWRTTAPLVWWPCCAATLPCACGSGSFCSFPDPLWSCLATPLVIPASYGLAAHWSCDLPLTTKSIFPSTTQSSYRENKKNLPSSLKQLCKTKTVHIG